MTTRAPPGALLRFSSRTSVILASAYETPFQTTQVSCSYPVTQPKHWISVSFGAGRTCTRGSRSDGALEISVRTGTPMDRHLLGNIELQPLDVVVERHGVRADIGNRRPRCGRAHVRINENLRLRQIHDSHVAGVIEAFDMVADDR